MSRTVTALYDTRAEAETAKARLQAEAGAQNTRILAKDTVAAIDGLKLSTSDTARYRDELSGGGHLLVAEIPDGKDAERIIRVLEQSMANYGSRDAAHLGGGVGTTVEEVRLPQIEEQIRVGTKQVERGGARVRSFVRETPAVENVSLRQEQVSVETRPAERRLTEDDVVSAGLLKERVVEVSEMMEEPIISKSAVVREEVILRKEVTERVQTITDTVRHTEVEVEELPRPSGGDGRGA